MLETQMMEGDAGVFVAEGRAWQTELTAVQKMRGSLGAYLELTKPKIQIMLLFTAYCAMIVAHHGFPGWATTLATLFGLALSTGGSAAINMWYDRDIDAIMGRTSQRPIPTGRVSANRALGFGLLLIVLSFVSLDYFVNPLTAWLSVSGAFYYAVIYTMWLKRRTPENIVIGGGAGSFPPLVGWAAMTGHLGIASVIMFLIIFLWTPPHFWALALYKNSDYVKANIPMMPVIKGPRSTKVQSIIYAVLLFAVSLLLPLTGAVGIAYTIIAAVAGAVFLAFTVMSYREPATEFKWAKRTFLISLAYLPVVFLFMVFSM
jgi:protoheme IX farnesyltransferase